MGKQSARMVYKGKDHKDIYFRGKYHDAMYLGYELLWHKIRNEGYYSLIVSNGKEGKFEKGLYVIIFDEKTRNFEIIAEIKDNPDIFTTGYYAGMYAMDSENIYISNLTGDGMIGLSIDGIHFEKTNLDVEKDQNVQMFVSNQSYHEYFSEEDSGIKYKKKYIWGYNNNNGTNNRIWLRKSEISKQGKEYELKYKIIETDLKIRDSYSTENSYHTWVPKYVESRFALYEENYVYKNDIVTKPDAIKDRYTKTTIKLYDIEKEESRKIVEFEYNSFKYNGNNQISKSIRVINFFHVSGCYLFFVQDSYEKYRIEREAHIYIYYSFDGFTYNNSVLYSKSVSENNYTEFYIPAINCVLHRNGMYYIYAGTESNDFYEPPYTLFLTTDFKHFQKKKIPREINIEGKTFNTAKLMVNEANSVNSERRYFYNGEVSEPKDGILTLGEIGLIYIDNMFFRESSGNKIFSYKEV